METGADTREQHLSPGSPTLPQSKRPLANADGSVPDIRSSSLPANNLPLHSAFDDIEQEFIPLIRTNAITHAEQSSHVEDILSTKNIDLRNSLVRNDENLKNFLKHSKITNDKVAGSDIVNPSEEFEFDADEDEEEEDGNDEGNEDDDEEEEGADVDSDDESDAVGGSDDNANVDLHDVDSAPNTDKHLEETKVVNANSEGKVADDLNQSVQAAPTVDDLSSNTVGTKTDVESVSLGLTEDRQPVDQQPVVSSDHTEFGQDSTTASSHHSNADVVQSQSSVVEPLTHSDHTGKDFSQQQVDSIHHRDYWRQVHQAGHMEFPGEFDQHLDTGTHPSVDWKYVEEFRKKWSEMQERYRTRPELMQEQWHYMNHMADVNHKFMQHDQNNFVNYQFDEHMSHVRPEDDHYLHRQTAQSNQFNRQIPNLVVSQQPNEDAWRRVHYRDNRDMFETQRHLSHNYHYQEPVIHQPNIHLHQVYREHPAGQRYRDPRKDDWTGSADMFSLSGSEQSFNQPQSSSAQSERAQWSRADKSPFDQSDIDKERSSQWTKTDLPPTVDFARKVQAGSPQNNGDADLSSTSQKYADAASQPPSPVIDRRTELFSGEFTVEKTTHKC